MPADLMTGERAAALRRELRDVEGDTRPLAAPGVRRLLEPASTVRRARTAMATAGITRVARLTGLDRIGIEVYAAYRPASRSLSVSLGKGATADAAQASALMESLEVWHAEQHRIPIIEETEERLRRTHRIVELPFLLRYEPQLPDPSRAIRWVEGLDLLSDEPVLVPYEVVHFDRRFPNHPGDGVFRGGTNGLASGNNHVEAVLHGLYEVVERDAVARLADRLDAQPRLDIGSVGAPFCRRLIDRFSAAGVALTVWDLGRVWGVPVFQAIGVERDGPWYHPLPDTWGFGAHYDPALALSRAMTEVAQVRAMLIAGARDDMVREEYAIYFDAGDAGPIEPDGVAELPLAGSAMRLDTLGEELRWLLEHLRSRGAREVIAVDLSDPLIGIAVVRVVVPGLWRQF